ncbi:MAG: hypothetical protein ABFD46_01605 [Armatimonadota bacterium]
MSELPLLANKLIQVSSNLHRASGLLTGISMGLYCIRSSKNIDSASKYIDDVQSMLDEMDLEISNAAKAVHEIETAADTEQK